MLFHKVEHKYEIEEDGLFLSVLFFFLKKKKKKKKKISFFTGSIKALGWSATRIAEIAAGSFDSHQTAWRLAGKPEAELDKEYQSIIKKLRTTERPVS